MPKRAIFLLMKLKSQRNRTRVGVIFSGLISATKTEAYRCPKGGVQSMMYLIRFPQPPAHLGNFLPCQRLALFVPLHTAQAQRQFVAGGD